MNFRFFVPQQCPLIICSVPQIICCSLHIQWQLSISKFPNPEQIVNIHSILNCIRDSIQMILRLQKNHFPISEGSRTYKQVTQNKPNAVCDIHQIIWALRTSWVGEQRRSTCFSTFSISSYCVSLLVMTSLINEIGTFHLFLIYSKKMFTLYNTLIRLLRYMTEFRMKYWLDIN